jgi:spore coat protein CotH
MGFTRKKVFVVAAFASFSICFASVSIYFAFKRNNYNTPPPQYKLEKLYVYIEAPDMLKLSELRDSALALGVLNRSPNDYVKTKVIYRSQHIEGKLRLKGDWTDHLEKDKWSFRIKLEQSMADGLKTFSIQNPKSRGFLLGYIYHKLLRQEGVLSPECRFVEVCINDFSWGTYVLEEHLTSRLISNQSEADGVLLKFDDYTFFNASSTDSTSPAIQQAEIRVYGKSKKEEENKDKVRLAKRIIDNYKYQVDTLYNSFNAKKTGTYYALCDLAAAYHAMGWINIRFYFNFNTQKMEPVGYDGGTQMDWGKPYLGYHAKKAKEETFSTKMIIYGALRNQAIEKEYISALRRVTDSVYVQQFMEEEQDFLNFIESELQKDHPEYEFDRGFLFDNAKTIRAKLMEE